MTAKYGVRTGGAFRSLEAIREERGLTVEKASCLLGISQEELMLVENCGVCVLKLLLVKIDQLYGISGGRFV